MISLVDNSRLSKTIYITENPVDIANDSVNFDETYFHVIVTGSVVLVKLEDECGPGADESNDFVSRNAHYHLEGDDGSVVPRVVMNLARLGHGPVHFTVHYSQQLFEELT